MLRPTRRPVHSRAVIAAALFSLTLAWPAATVAVGGRPAPSGGVTSDAGERAPTIESVGVRPFESDVPGGASRQLQELGIERVGRRVPQAEIAGSDTTGAAAPDPVQSSNSGAPAATSFGPWEGIDEATAGFEPADPWVAVGPDDVVQTVNARLRFTNREGTSTAADVEAYDFFDLDSDPFSTGFHDGVGQPRWHYDSRHDRWVGLLMSWHCDTDGSGTGDDSLGYVHGAISVDGDPTGDYYHFFIQYDFLPDSPMIGISGDKLAVSVNEFTLNNTANCTSGGAFDASSVTTFDWANLLTFPASPLAFYDFSFDHFSLRPAVAPQATSNTIFVVGEALLPDPEGTTTSNVAYYRITGTNAGGNIAATNPIDLTAAGIVAAFEDPPTPEDPGGSFGAGIVDRRPTDAIWRDNVLTFVSTYPCDASGGATEINACGRVTQLDTSSGTPSRIQDMLVAVNGRDIWYPGVGQSQSGTLHVVYSQSGDAEAISSYDRYQLTSDAPNTLSAAVEIANGASAYSGARWGSWVGVAQDPRDTNAVWQGNAYAKSGGTWGTRVSELQTAGSTFVPIDPVRLLDSRFNIGTTGAFAHGVPKTIDIAGRGGVPDDAVAITGNLTVVGQNGAGYASLTQQPIADPSTSTINFPLGDTRANNVTSPLSSSGGVSITYRAAPGRTTHFILDVTGYFLNEEVAASHTFTSMTPVRVLDTRFDVGLNNAFQANQNRTFDVAGRLGIPAGAKAITGNLTVVGQTRAGYVTLATNPPPSLPATSTINFPAGDTRANGVTVKLSAAGGLSAVYKAPPGATTHLILDVTGYYLNDLNGARFVPLTPGRRMDTRFPAPQEGLSGRFSANVARTLVVEPYQGVPANATAISGNLTVVGQTRAGFVSMTTTANNNPTTSTLNFPLGDIRANGVTGPLSGAGGVGLVYKASSGQTHLILDLTGYFR